MGDVDNGAGIRRVLVVDDNKDVAGSTAMLLRRVGALGAVRSGLPAVEAFG